VVIGREFMSGIRTLPNIEIDQDRCISPMNCGKCLQACPAVVLLCIPTYNEKFRECHDDDFQVMVHNRPACTGCMKCVEVCPEDCIRIEFEGATAAA